MKSVVLIAAMDSNRAIGFDNRLPWHLPDDLQRFKDLTVGKTLLMGRKTAESLGRALPHRQNLVLSRTGRVPFSNMQPVDSWQAALDVCHADELIVIGGGEVYALALPFAQQLHLTHVQVCLPQADTYFPVFDVSHWQPIARQSHDIDARHKFCFEWTDYVRAVG
jgi:dihydrofolate reductase